jgi:hypothetical protein
VIAITPIIKHANKKTNAVRPNKNRRKNNEKHKNMA